MGCDIHLYHEKKVGNQWVAADAWERSAYEEDQGRLTVPYGKELYDGRNYNLFAVLANVRNGYGFAGIVTGTPIKPICLPRGVPIDACDEYRLEVEAWNGDGHSHSWLTLADLDAYAWDLPKQHRGIVALQEYRRWKASGDKQPQDYSGAVTGPGIRILSEAEAIELHRNVSTTRYYVEAWWTTTIHDDCAEFLGIVRPRLQELEQECGPGNARLLFFFDN